MPYRCTECVLFLIVLASAALTLAFIFKESSHSAYDAALEDKYRMEESNRRRIVYLPRETDVDYPIVIWWSDMQDGRAKRYTRDCERGSCLFTPSRTEFDNPLTRGFLFYGTFLHWEDLPVPRAPNHLWFLLHEESPKNNWLLALEEGISLFNLTATPSRYSDFPLTTLYLPSAEYLEAPPQVPTQDKSKDGLGIANYVQSDCNVPSDRDAYVKQLMGYLDIDSYGACLHNKDLPENIADPIGGMYADGFLNLQAHYKFTLVFENAICEDYITEKLWRPLHVGSVPVVRGSPTIRDWLPDNMSAIIVDDFSSPKDLAEHLELLASNDDRYSEYLRWKETGITNQRLLNNLRDRTWDDDEGGDFVSNYECFVCDYIHSLKKNDGDEQHSKHDGKDDEQYPRVANKRHFNCSSVEPVVRRGIWGILPFDELNKWIEEEECSKKKARLIHELLVNNATLSEFFSRLRSHSVDFSKC